MELDVGIELLIGLIDIFFNSFLGYNTFSEILSTNLAMLFTLQFLLLFPLLFQSIAFQFLSLFPFSLLETFLFNTLLFRFLSEFTFKSDLLKCNQILVSCIPQQLILLFITQSLKEFLKMGFLEIIIAIKPSTIYECIVI